MQTNRDSDVGRYVLNMETSLPSFPMVPPILTSFTIEILTRPYNKLPYFSPSLPKELSIDMLDPKTHSMVTPWSFVLPPTKDDDKFDTVYMSHSFGKASNFLRLVDNELEIADIRQTNTTKLEPGFYPLFFYLTDGKN